MCSKVNLHFKPPVKETFQICDELEMKINYVQNENIKKILQNGKQIYMAKADQAGHSIDKIQLLTSTNIYTATFDLQKMLPFPRLTTSTAYYERNLYIYNFRIHLFNSNSSLMLSGMKCRQRVPRFRVILGETLAGTCNNP
ncbi:hypothetical protein X975_03120, partial [Stegodyphus mimosarum]